MATRGDPAVSVVAALSGSPAAVALTGANEIVPDSGVWSALPVTGLVNVRMSVQRPAGGDSRCSRAPGSPTVTGPLDVSSATTWLLARATAEPCGSTR